MNNRLATCFDSFSIEDFKLPSPAFSPVYNWTWNGEVTKEESESQLLEFQRLGIKSFCIIPEPKDFRPTTMPTFLTPDYLTKPYFEEYLYVVKRAKELGMTVLLYDEGGWPSGSACGKVMLKHPEYARRVLEKREISLACSDTYIKSKDAVAAYVSDKEIEDGYIAKADCTVTEYYEDILNFKYPGSPEIPDVTRREATECFIELTHEGYKEYLHEYFGDTVTCVFTDEPKGPGPVPFREELEKKFLEENGYSIRKYLPALMSDDDMTEDAAKAKIAWYDMCSRLLRDNYILPCKEWSNKHGMLFTGHMDGDHSALCSYTRFCHYHLMRALRCFDIPGIDAIWRQIYPTYINNGRDVLSYNNGFFPRYASSAAAQTGSRRALTESFGVYGAGLTFDKLRYVLGYQAVRGVNVFNLMSITYSREGFHMMSSSPKYTENQACYKYLPAFNSFAERLSYLASLGERAANVGYYLPVNDLLVENEKFVTARIYEDIGQRLEDENALFDIIDDDVIQNSVESCKDGIISMGNGRYDTVVVPECRYMSDKAKAILSEFAKNGGRLIIVSEKKLPCICGAEYTENIKGMFTPAMELYGECEKIRLGVRYTDNGTLYILFNENADERTFGIKNDGKLVRLYAENGDIREYTSDKITLGSGESAFLFDGEIPCEKEASYSQKTELCDNWYIKRKDRFVIGYMNFETETFEEPYTKTTLGEFAPLYGDGYSGRVVYKTSFKAPKKEGKILLDLGDVRYTCEVFVNGISKGVLAMSPYRLELCADELCEENILEVCVANTPANEYACTKSFEKWQLWQLGTYYPTQQLYLKESSSGGLAGPVVMRF